MKQLVVISAVILIACAVGYVWLHEESGKDQGELIGIAIGNPHENVLELHVVVSLHAVRAGSVSTSGRGGAQNSPQWIKDHYDLRDSAGQTVPFSREGHSDLISDQKACNPEFFLRAKVRAGEAYTFDYIPDASVGQRYRHTFTVPPEGLPFVRPNFGPVPAN